MTTILRPAAGDDAAAIAAVYLASRRAFVPFARLAHCDDEVTRWIAETLVPGGGVTVAVRDGVVVGMMATSRENALGWIDHLYVAPRLTGTGIGSLLLALAKSDLGAPIHLYTFQANHVARRFYERHGFAPITFTDGQANEEKCPDVLYRWPSDT